LRRARPREESVYESLRTMSKASPARSSTVQPNAVGIASALVAWFGVQLAAVGGFDAAFVGSLTGERFIWLGASLCMLGTFALGMQKLKRPVGAAKLWLLSIGLMPITMFLLFLAWRIALSVENRAACDEGDPVACRTVAQVRAKRGKTEDAISLYERGCELNDARSCRELGGQARILPDKVSATSFEFYEKACDLGDALGCDRAANMLRQDEPERAQALFQKACDLGYLSACSSLYE